MSGRRRSISRGVPTQGLTYTSGSGRGGGEQAFCVFGILAGQHGYCPHGTFYVGFEVGYAGLGRVQHLPCLGHLKCGGQASFLTCQGHVHYFLLGLGVTAGQCQLGLQDTQIHISLGYLRAKRNHGRVIVRAAQGEGCLVSLKLFGYASEQVYLPACGQT